MPANKKNKPRKTTAKRTFSSSLRICWFTDWFANIFFLHSMWEISFPYKIDDCKAQASNDETSSIKKEEKFLFEMVIKYLQCNQYPNSLMVRKWCDITLRPKGSKD